MKQAAVPVVGSRLRDDAQTACHRPTIFRCHHTLDDLYFTDGFCAHDIDFVVRPVARDVRRPRRAVRVTSVRRDVHRTTAEAVQPETVPGHTVARITPLDQARTDREDVRNVAVGHGQGCNFQGFHADPLLCGQCVHERRFTGHGDIVGHGADLQHKGSPHVLCAAQRHAAAFVSLEARQSDFKCVGADGHVVE